ncbi:hypothetical protein pdam_00022696 [Pocillopora damicornis]|uniref:Uncharacterized protein n=1 Tax=Pocillopora damicornis TaxID=46731 RepID=A0A3M6UW00_POCDA|nr:hypothetical protein pdam_00022696 [Pocillopora damicornis]
MIDYTYQAHSHRILQWNDSIFTRVYSCVSKIGSAGPDSIGSHYNYQDHDRQVTLFSGIQLWTVPRNGDYRIEAIGTSGGYGENSIIKTGGRGARVINRLVGQKGEKWNSNRETAGGGGGTFVVKENNKSLIIAGGVGGVNIQDVIHP